MLHAMHATFLAQQQLEFCKLELAAVVWWRPSQDPCPQRRIQTHTIILVGFFDMIPFLCHKAALRIQDMRSVSNFPNNYRAAPITEVQVPWLMNRGTVSSIYHQSLTFRIEFDKTNIIWHFNLLKPTGYVMHQQFNIQQLYALLTLYLCVLYLSENKQRLVPLTA